MAQHAIFSKIVSRVTIEKSSYNSSKQQGKCEFLIFKNARCSALLHTSDNRQIMGSERSAVCGSGIGKRFDFQSRTHTKTINEEIRSICRYILNSDQNKLYKNSRYMVKTDLEIGKENSGDEL